MLSVRKPMARWATAIRRQHAWPRGRELGARAPPTNGYRRAARLVMRSFAEATFFGPSALPRPASPRQPFMIGVAGGTASGKTSVCDKIIEKLHADEDRCGRGVLSIAQDCFYKDLTAQQQDNIAQYNFDHPDAFDFQEIVQTLERLRRGEAVHIPRYDFVTSSRCAAPTRVAAADVILFDGILAFYPPELRDLFDLRIFVDVDADTRLARRLRRDIVERGRNVLAVLDQYERTVKPSFESFILPTKKHADVIIPRGAANSAAIDLIWQNIRYQLDGADTHLAAPAR